MKININRHGPRLLHNIRQRLDPLYFSLPITFKHGQTTFWKFEKYQVVKLEKCNAKQLQGQFSSSYIFDDVSIFLNPKNLR